VEFEWFRSAGVAIHSDRGGSLLCDPWMNDGALLGSWFHWPPLAGDESDRLLSHAWDAVYITHLHGDHYDRPFMSKLAKAHPNTKVVIASFAHPWLRNSLENIGFSGRILETQPSSMTEVAPGISMTAIAADHCNPRLCGANVPCVSPLAWSRAIDSLGVIEVDGVRVLNANDATTVVHSMPLYASLPPIDIMLTAYAGASPYPQAFTNLSDEERTAAARTKADAFLGRVANVSRIVKPRMLFPFAGQHMLGGSLTALNEFRGMYPLLESARLLREKQDASVFTLQPFSRVDPTAGLLSDDSYREPTQEVRADYLEAISSVQFPYQKRSIERVAESDHVARLFSAAEGLAWRYRELGWSMQKSLVVGSELGSVTLNVDGSDTEVREGVLPRFEYTSVSTDPRLLDSIIRRKPGYSGFTDAHMNVADGGNHLQWFREGAYDPQLTSLLFFL